MPECLEGMTKMWGEGYGPGGLGKGLFKELRPWVFGLRTVRQVYNSSSFSEGKCELFFPFHL